ncbi:MAG: hypothetical protein RMK29_11305 [Myxococcales bacterium]|nr:hypothetical protein [Myxococcota bacterium]MDW8282294.1 hypothetical protein [Myxococcales bacterium]
MAPVSRPSPDLRLHELLDELGFSGANEARARQELEQAGLTRPGKQRIAAHKRERVQRLLQERFLLVCSRSSCQQEARTLLDAGDGRQLLCAERPGDCALCSGSGNRQAVDRMCALLGQHGLQRLVVLGGSPNAREALRALVGDRIELRLIDGTERRTQAEARADLRWADLVVIWGGTELDHKVSSLYSHGAERPVLTIARRGIAALADGLREHLERAGPAR